MKRTHPNGLVLSRYVDRELRPRTFERIRSHLAGCRICGDAVHDHRTVNRIVKETPRP